MPKNPTSYLYIPSFEDAVFSDTSSQGGASWSNGIPNSSNAGSLSLIATGEVTAASPDTLSVRVQDSGGIDTTTFTWKKTTGSEFLGENDRRFSSMHSDPFAPYDVNEGTRYYGFGLCLGYVLQGEREFAIIASNTTFNSVKIAYRSAFLEANSQLGGNWTTVERNLRTLHDRGVAFSGSAASSLAQIATCTLNDGTALIAVVYSHQIDIYKTTDGINWSLLAENIVGRFAYEEISRTTTQQILSLHIATSGNFVRIGYVAYNSSEGEHAIYTLTSNDRGLTWRASDVGLVTAGTNSGSGGDRFSFSLCGLNDASGSFMVVNYNPSTIIMETYIAVGSQALSRKDHLTYPLSDMNNVGSSLALCKGTDAIFVMIDYNVQASTLNQFYNGGTIPAAAPYHKPFFLSAVGEQTILTLPINANFDTESWKDLGEDPYGTIFDFGSYYGEKPLTPRISGFCGCIKYRFNRVRMQKIGSSIALVASLRDRQIQSSAGEVPYNIYMRFGGFSTRPVNDYFDDTVYINGINPDNKHQLTGPLWNVQWESWNGAPAGVLYASSISNWEEFRSVCTRMWSAEYTRISTNGATANQHLYYEWVSSQGQYNLASGQQASGFFETPPRNWMFATNMTFENPKTQPTPASSAPLKSPSGSVIEWSCLVRNTDTTGTTRNRGCAVQVDAYVGRLGQVQGSPQGEAPVVLSIEVQIGERYVKVVHNSLPSKPVLATLDGTNITTSLGSTPFRARFWEFRLAFLPNSSNSRATRVMLMCRPEGSDNGDWINTPMISPTTQEFSWDQTNDHWYAYQRVRFGCLDATPASGSGSDAVASYWRRIRVHTGNDLDSFSLGGLFVHNPQPDCIRGYPVTNNLIYTEQGRKLLWAGASGAEGDLFEAGVNYAYAVENILHKDSPQQQWRSTALAAGVSTTFTMPTVDGAVQRNIVSGLAIVSTNAERYVLSGRESSGSSFDTIATLPLERTRARVMEASSGMYRHTYKVSFDGGKIPFEGEYQSSETTGARKYYAKLENTTTSLGVVDGLKYVILDHYGEGVYNEQYIQLKGLPTDTRLAAGTTLVIYGDRGYVGFSPTRKYVQYRLEAFGNTKEPEGYIYCGTAVVGNTLLIDPELSWRNTIDEKPNTTGFRSRSGISWSYTEGASVRSYKGKIEGDVSEQMRNNLKNTIRRATNFDQKPLFLVLQDGSQDSNQMIFGRVAVGANTNIGWYYDASMGRWVQVGDLSLTVTEVV